MSSAYPHQEFWHDKRVLLTGHTGFKGSWLALWLNRLGAEVAGLSLSPSTDPNLFDLAGIDGITRSHICDIRKAQSVKELVSAENPEIVFHLAAQPLVRASYENPLDTFSTNVQGTANVLDALRGQNSVRSVVVVTTDKVYQNLEQAYPFRETDHLGGHDPYSASKAASEIVIDSYRKAFLQSQGGGVASARAGNVIGGGDWSADRLIPDAVRAWSSNLALEVRRPGAVRPWQHVLEPLAGYIRLAEKLWECPELAGAYNFGPETHEAASVRKVIELAMANYENPDVIWGDGQDGPHEAGWLALEVAKVRNTLGVEPVWGLMESVQRTMEWYAKQREGLSAKQLCDEDLDAYELALRQGGQS